MTDMDRYTQELRDALAAKDARIAELEANLNGCEHDLASCESDRAALEHAMTLLAAREAELAEVREQNRMLDEDVVGLSHNISNIEPILAAKDARIAELEVAKYPGCKLLSLGDACPCKICDLERRLAAREAELATWAPVLNGWTPKTLADELQAHVDVVAALECGDGYDAPADIAARLLNRVATSEAELATVRGALEDIREWVAYRKDYSVVCRELTERLVAALAALAATPPRRTPDATEEK
jgi:hypothetical protein